MALVTQVSAWQMALATQVSAWQMALATQMSARAREWRWMENLAYSR